MVTPRRITPRDAHRRVAWEEALLVCAYDDPEKFQRSHLCEAISLDGFKSRLPTLSKNQEIVFYCNEANDAIAMRRAAEYQDQGFSNAMVLAGGMDAWAQAGYAILEMV